MSYLILLSSNAFIGSNGILSVQTNGKQKEFFRIREIFKERSPGSYLAVDVDVKDKEGKRQIKLAKNKPIIIDEGISISTEHSETHVTDGDNKTIIRIKQLEDPQSIINGRIDSMWGLRDEEKEKMKANIKITDGIQITGVFYADNHKIELTDESMRIDDGMIVLSDNTSIGAGGIVLKNDSFSF